MTGATGLLGRQMMRTLSSTSWEARLGSTSWGPHHGAPSAQVLRLASVIFSSGYLDIDIPCLLFNTCRSHWHLVFASLFCIFWMILAGLWAFKSRTQPPSIVTCDLTQEEAFWQLMQQFRPQAWDTDMFRGCTCQRMTWPGENEAR